MNTNEINERLRMSWDRLEPITKSMLQNFAEQPSVFGQGYVMGYMTALVDKNYVRQSDAPTWFMVIGEIAAGEPGSHIILSWPVA